MVTFIVQLELGSADKFFIAYHTLNNIVCSLMYLVDLSIVPNVIWQLTHFHPFISHVLSG